MTVRVIPRLDIKGPNLVKGIHFEGLRVLGRPESFARHYYHQGADELLYIDVVASLYGRNSLLDIVERTAREIFIPLTVGGGLRNLDDIRAVLRAGADKVAINTAAIANPHLIRQAAMAFGSSTIVVSIQAKLGTDGRYRCLANYGREDTGIDAFEWACRAVDLGAGELLVSSMDREGTGQGFDLDLTRHIAESVSVPVIACGGAGCVEHVAEAVKRGRADAVAVASLFHYRAVRDRSVRMDSAVDEGNTEFIASGRTFAKIRDCSVADVKHVLAAGGIDCRPPELAIAL